jgi:hypothetical protein
MEVHSKICMVIFGTWLPGGLQQQTVIFEPTYYISRAGNEPEKTTSTVQKEARAQCDF